MGDMIAQDDFFRPSQRRTHGCDLGDDIDAKRSSSIIRPRPRT
jgi:hypothetical protein